MSEQLNDDLKAAYQQVCEGYRAIDEMRTKLLGLLPLATGAGILVLSGRGSTGPPPALSAAIGSFGILATLGLFSYELHSMKKCGALIDAGRKMEKRLNINGQFIRRPQEVAGFIDEPFAASLIYPASLAGWTFFALLGVPARWVAFTAAAVVFVAWFGCSLWLIRAIEHDAREGKQYCKEPLVPRKDEPDKGPLPDDAYIRPPREHVAD
jgi:hypothetical protein